MVVITDEGVRNIEGDLYEFSHGKSTHILVVRGTDIKVLFGVFQNHIFIPEQLNPTPVLICREGVNIRKLLDNPALGSWASINALREK